MRAQADLSPIGHGRLAATCQAPQADGCQMGEGSIRIVLRPIGQGNSGVQDGASLGR
jgi:hypothetical protein